MITINSMATKTSSKSTFVSNHHLPNFRFVFLSSRTQMAIIGDNFGIFEFSVDC